MGTQITNYATLAAVISTWDDRTHDADEIIGLAEGEIRNALGPNYARETTGTITTDSSGNVALPSGFIRAIALTHATYGPVFQRSLIEIRDRRVWDTSGIPSIFAISGAQMLVAPVYEGDLTFDYESKLGGLNSTTTTNWLITTAPHIYVSMCMSVAKAKFQDFESAGIFKQDALAAIDRLDQVTRVARVGSGGVALPGVTP